MTDRGGKIRLFVAAGLEAGAGVALTPEQAHYLFAVMRQGVGGRIAVFNGRDGEWAAEIAEAGRRGGHLVVRERTRPQQASPDLWLMFAPLKKARTDFVVEKATELGVACLRPVFTRRTNAERLRGERLRALAIEAAEQCGATAVPEVAEPERLGAVLDGWEGRRRILFCDESGAAPPAREVLAGAEGGAWAVLIGPEGGFAPEETERLRGMASVLPVSLGPRILRADTAAVAALTLWQALLGDWR
ncbi:MAG TPA: 16S rRNA (uracil(1498)-N(3))-methyltransferase [Amaricoccus sp.]|nr:16S rRNA (uracil(1498)-N(3))-methyltransferase [Paracoccaceae bacterium]MCB1402270.1 16S rRNA (uracil(1498)-N(3))-methyltransferase [Paracoccaceae bacterium]MCC0065952.1 16S rRNA (uracil(1498)-N(3))-methyltransferase [Rhodovulum sp.]HPG22743.1 16S rRNA (uracil(1498)-N(3))-methyltransferase [Amaricoccus sp.]